MAEDPYEILGVDRDATTAEINKAFKKKAKGAHPNAGGKREDWDKLKSAQLVLIDPTRRDLFDRTGATDEPARDPDVDAVGHIARILQDCLMGDADPNAVKGLVDQMVNHLTMEIEEANKKMPAHRRAILRAEKLRKRFKKRRTGSGVHEPVMDILLDQNVKSSRAAIALQEKDIRERRRAIEILNDYDFEAEQLTPLMSAYFSSRYSFPE